MSIIGSSIDPYSTTVTITFKADRKVVQSVCRRCKKEFSYTRKTAFQIRDTCSKECSAALFCPANH